MKFEKGNEVGGGVKLDVEEKMEVKRGRTRKSWS